MEKKFAQIKRIGSIYRPVEECKQDWQEVERTLPIPDLEEQASRCMNCGIPFCHGWGCPLGNVIPDINTAAARGIGKRHGKY